MSWSINIPKTATDDFGTAVDTAEAQGGDAQVQLARDQISLAKDILIRLAGALPEPFISGYAGGHAHSEGDSNNFMSVSVNGFESAT